MEFHRVQGLFHQARSVCAVAGYEVAAAARQGPVGVDAGLRLRSHPTRP